VVYGPVTIPTAEETCFDALPCEFRHVDRLILYDIYRIIEVEIAVKSVSVADKNKGEDYDKRKDISSEREKASIGIELEYFHGKPLLNLGYPPKRIPHTFILLCCYG